MLGSFLVSLGLTLLLEGIVVLAWGLRRRDLALFVLVNVLTNPTAVLLHALFPGWAVTLAIEAAVAAVEGFCYARLGDSVHRPWLLALVANGFSFSMGLLVNVFL